MRGVCSSVKLQFKHFPLFLLVEFYLFYYMDIGKHLCRLFKITIKDK